MSAYADVIINRKSPAVDRVFTYRVPEPMRESLRRGMLVRVPLNREKLEGVVVALHDEEPRDFAVRDIIETIGDQPLFSGELLALSGWLADFYHCSRAAAMQAMLPSGMNLAGKKPRTAYYEVYLLSNGYRQYLTSAKRRELAAVLAGTGEASASFLAERGFSRAYLQSCCKAGMLARESRRILAEAEIYNGAPAGLNDQQQAAYEAIKKERAGSGRPVLLHGVTGSGKTEIYIRLINEAAARGEQSILLVPEIALSAQMVDMMSRRLDMPLALLHSGLLQSERRKVWQDIAEGRISVVVGARSAIFAPTPRLGLIIIDEEHETSYKQENTPRFHAVTVARKRAELAHAQLVLGSATPSVESYYEAEQGRYVLAELTRQYYPAPAPQISIVDMRQELKAGHRLIFSRELIAALDDTLAHGGQSILFLNRRGYYTFVSCRDCGESISCPHCAVTMCYHASGGGLLKCHYCGYTQKPPRLCPVCGSPHIRHFGVGTQRVAEEAARLFPRARIGRLDSDVMSERDGHQRIYEAMLRREIDILVGTQMVAKGLDFPHLELAAVIAADSLLNLPDWRANERTFQLISQVCGRAGRRERQGRAIIQTYMPEAPPVVLAAERDYTGFFHAELLQRQLHGYPPFCRMLRLLFTAKEQSGLVEATAAYAHYLAEELREDTELCGPADAPYARIKDRFRRQIILKTADTQAAAAAAEKAWARLQKAERLPGDILFSMDIDPMTMF